MSAYADEGDAVIEMDLLPPRWLDIQDEVTEQLKDIAINSARLDKMLAKHVLPSFEEDHVRKRDEAAIEQLTQDITRGYRQCQQAVQRIQSMVREQREQGSLNQGEEMMAKNMQTSLAARIQEQSASFRKKQSAYLNSKPNTRDTMFAILMSSHQNFGRWAVWNRPSIELQLPFRILTPIHR